MEHLSSIVFYTVLLKCFKREQIQELWLRRYTGHLKLMCCIISLIDTPILSSIY